MLLGITTAGYKVADTVTAKTAEQRKSMEGFFADWRKDWDGFFAEARERAHAKPKRSEATAKA